tara:strand:+ start:525 stop:662 length:138 start_codon:yes stop_codon:yes gene_type:complete
MKIEIYKPIAKPEVVSGCCGYAIIENTDLCSKCKNHCEEEILECD